MRSLQRLLGNDLAGLIYQKLHEMLMAQLLMEYHASVFAVVSTTSTFIEICPASPGGGRNWKLRKCYNWRDEIVNFFVYDKSCVAVARLSKNYWHADQKNY